MPRQDIHAPARERHSDDTPVEQRPTAANLADRDGDVILVERIGNADYLDELAFMQEPVTIRLEPSNDKNAITAFPVWVNGIGAEVFQNGRWRALTWLPTGLEIIVKRMVLEVIARTKVDTIHTEVRRPESDKPFNAEQRFTSPVHSFSVILDKNPRGAAWLTEMRRRNF